MRQPGDGVRPCDFGSECSYLAQCPDCDSCWDHCRCWNDGFASDSDGCIHGVSFDEECARCDDDWNP
jgi:hypothetical protein